MASEVDYRKGEYRTILSIDGGGIRGIIPGVILEFLEAQLKVMTITLHFNFFVFKARVDFKGFEQMLGFVLC